MIRLFKHYVPYAVILVGVLDLALLYLAGDLSWRLRAAQIGMDPGEIGDRFWQLAGHAGVMLAAMIAVGVYGPEALRSMRYATARLVVAISFGIIGLAVLDFLVGGGNFWRSTLAYAMIGSVFTLVLNRLMVGAAVGAEAFRRRVLVLGAGNRAERLRRLSLRPECGFRIGGFVAMEDGQAVVPDPVARGSIENLAGYVEGLGVSEVVLALEERRNALPLTDLLRIKTAGVLVHDFSSFIEREPDTKVIVASGHGARDSALQAIARGAYDFYQKPVDIERLGLIVQRALQLHQIEAENRQLAARRDRGSRVLGRLITGAPEMVKVARTIERVANTSVSVMLLGASGTGKELLARGLHEASDRSGRAFVAINCAAIPENLLESELFGHEKGAFTGAVKTTEGKIEQAQGGTLFLDEVGDIPLPLQVKLLRFLQERVIERIGSRKPIPVDTRIVCATHQNLEAMIAAGSFREDLFYRLAEIVVHIPGLAERPGDAVLLAKTFLARFARDMNPQVQGFAADALAAIAAWHWPGNVRELENRVKRAVIMAEGKLVNAADLDLADKALEEASVLNLKSARETADRRVIRHALARCEGNISNTAKLLGISRPTLYDLLKQYDLSP